MPAGSPWAVFNQARATGITKTTYALDRLFADKRDDLVTAIKAGPIIGLPEPFLGALIAEDLDDREIAHIKSWPDGQKEDVRVAIKNAIDNDQEVRFFWRLTNNDAESTSIEPGPGRVITIIFYSPWRKVRVVGPDDVTVDV